MDNSTEGVNLLGVFIVNILDIYKDKPDIHTNLIEQLGGIDLSEIVSCA